MGSKFPSAIAVATDGGISLVQFVIGQGKQMQIWQELFNIEIKRDYEQKDTVQGNRVLHLENAQAFLEWLSYV